MYGVQPGGQPAIVGIGTSAGGIDPLMRIFASLPSDAGLAYVVVQHLAPEHESHLHELLARAAAVPVTSATDGDIIRPDHAYVCPPGVYVQLEQGTLRLRPTADGERAPVHPIDRFFRSLALGAGPNAIGVVLSGSASDGAAGLREIDGAGGYTIAQAPETASYPSMPDAAIATGAVHAVLSPEDIARELPRVAEHRPLHAPLHDDASPPPPLARIFLRLQRGTGVDFALYKKATVRRRIERRMAARRVSELGEYAQIVDDDPEEVQRLFRDLLIHVTQFFREPEAFEALKTRVLSEILQSEHGQVRIWVPGCAGGEEAYTLAILVLELLGERADRPSVQIFGTDLADGEIERARLGSYSPSIAADVSPERLKRFFSAGAEGYRVSKAMREMCVFARHDLVRDPPFSKLDLVVCRNVLIYLSPQLQDRVMRTLHYALRETGWLMLGASETIGSRADLFAIADKKHRIYRRKPGASVMPGVSGGPSFRHDPARRQPPRAPRRSRVDVDRYLADRYAPAALLVDADMTIVETRGRTAGLLEPQPGEASLELRSMVRPNVADTLRALIMEARTSGTSSSGHRIPLGGATDPTVDVEVVPLGSPEERAYVVLLGEPRPAPEQEPGEESPRLRQLEQELAASRQHMHAMIRDLEAANEELQSANEEILSSNEELQSANEELDTAREELQSTNEELNTLNEELHARNEELSLLNSDLTNLVASVNLAIVIVDRDRRIRRFTPAAERVLNLIPGDVGRPIAHVRPNVDIPELDALIEGAIEQMAISEREVRDMAGRSYSLRIRPYKDQDNRIDGAVLSLVDIERLKQHEVELTEARDRAEAIVQTVRQPLLVLDRELRVVSTNEAFCDWFGVERTGADGHFIADLDVRYGAPELVRALTDVADNATPIESFALAGPPPGGREGQLVLNARRLDDANGRPPLVLVGIDMVRGPAS